MQIYKWGFWILLVLFLVGLGAQLAWAGKEAVESAPQPDLGETGEE